MEYKYELSGSFVAGTTDIFHALYNKRNCPQVVVNNVPSGNHYEFDDDLMDDDEEEDERHTLEQHIQWLLDEGYKGFIGRSNHVIFYKGSIKKMCKALEVKVSMYYDVSSKTSQEIVKLAIDKLKFTGLPISK